ncbi:hypothetical protein EFK50_08840 [Nocardioides marmoriginsengisoli]|uniref:Uncharacterized protein n=1 Tax=Nocardioides marmoriginsengisoli TaxID=661483 RepID=A0A3N0CEP8_9ACTN|nr:hypothetical protein [Nocardioides marmoriginsengisoli]RNL61927.1 hypothetical protein EFK50_08840 [Nocardioides marmoriginsengisoli]
MSVQDQLAAAGLEVPPDELDGIVAWIEGSRAMAQVLYADPQLPPPCSPGRIAWTGDSDD